MYNENYLQHHGILGMKWGVRRYQNRDGSLTREGVLRNQQNGVITKGQKIYRVANSDEPVDHRRKYVTTDEKDAKRYVNMTKKSFFWANLDPEAHALYADYNKPISQFMYEAKDDIRVASGKEMVDAILDQYKDETRYETMKRTWTELIANPSVLDGQEETRRQAMVGLQYMFDAKESEVIDYLKSQGYGASVDPVDVIGKISNYPVILLDPVNDVSVVSNKEIHNPYLKKSK